MGPPKSFGCAAATVGGGAVAAAGRERGKERRGAATQAPRAARVVVQADAAIGEGELATTRGAPAEARSERLEQVVARALQTDGDETGRRWAALSLAWRRVPLGGDRWARPARRPARLAKPGEAFCHAAGGGSPVGGGEAKVRLEARGRRETATRPIACMGRPGARR